MTLVIRREGFENEVLILRRLLDEDRNLASGDGGHGVVLEEPKGGVMDFGKVDQK